MGPGTAAFFYLYGYQESVAERFLCADGVPELPVSGLTFVYRRLNMRFAVAVSEDTTWLERM